jgi:uncharacterized protein (DUF1800 family)
MPVSINPYKGAWTRREVVHLLKRAMFGAKPEDVDYFQRKTTTQTIDELLVVPAAPSPPVNNYNINGYEDPTGIKLGESWVTALYGDGTVNGRRRNSMKAWWVGQMVSQGRSLEEKMVLFWHNHFATEMDTIQDSRLVYKHHVVLRKYALGNFKAFTKAVTIDPGMLIYLNGIANINTAPDENYARELQELFTLGKGPNSKYTEDDVKAAAKILTGYQVNRDKMEYLFNPNRHDRTDKTFSAFYGNKVIKGRTGADGEKEVDELLDMIFAQNEVAMHICRVLYRNFVYYEITPEVEQNFIMPLAKIFRDANYEIKPVLRALFLSEHFYDVNVMGAVIKSPLDGVVGMAREFGVAFPDKTDTLPLYGLWATLQNRAATMQQDIGDPPNVSGWQAYYQEPQFHELWINSDTYPKRGKYAFDMMGSGFTNNGKKIVVDVLAFANKLPNPEDVNKIIDQSLEILYRIDVSTETRNSMKALLLSNQTSDYYWSDAWNAYKAKPNDAMIKKTVEDRLKALYNFITSQPEYQLS